MIMSTFDVRQQAVEGRPNAFQLTVSGDVDISTSPALDDALDELIAADARLVVLDLADVTFLDSTGLRSIMRASRALAERDGRLTCAGLSSPARRVMEISGLLPELTEAGPETAPD